MEIKYLGIDLGGTNIKSVVLNDIGQILDKQIILTEDSSNGSEKWKQNIIDLIERKTQEYANGNTELLKCGISAPGLVGKDNLQISHMPGRLKGLEGYVWSEKLNRDIIVINDAHSASLAEYETYYKDDISNMLLLTLGTGVGGAAILDKQLYQGDIQRAGHFGHISVDYSAPRTMTNIPGSLEYAIGDFSIKERTNGFFNNTKELVDAYREGNTLATHWWLLSIQKLAIGLSSLINSFSPELIILGGGIANADDLLFKPLKEFMKLYEWSPNGISVELRKTKYENYAGAIGAAFFAKKNNKTI